MIAPRRSRSSALLMAALPVLAGLAAPAAARAESLAEAIALAYDSNPTLLSQRAQLRAVNEQYVQAESGFRPTVNAQVTGNYSEAPQTSLFGGTSEVEGNTGEAALIASQPIYTGGRTVAQVQAAKAQIQAGREQLRQVEAQVLFDVVRAYSDVLRDRASLQIQRDSLKELRDAVAEIRARRDAGAATVIDVEQANAQLQGSEAQVASAQAQLETSVAAYVAAVGQSPGDLTAPPPLPGVPASLEEALAVSNHESPAILQARAAESASRAQVREARAAYLPTVNVNASLGYTGQVEPFIRQNYQRAAAVGVTFTQPIFAGGLNASRTRQASAQDSAALMQINVSQRGVIQSVAQAWSLRHAAQLNTQSQDAASASARAAYDGMRVEYRAGLRQTLDLLIAQEAVRDTQVALAAARHDDYVSAAQLLATVGRLEAGKVAEGVKLYDPEREFKRVKWSGVAPSEVVPKVLDRIVP